MHTPTQQEKAASAAGEIKGSCSLCIFKNPCCFSIAFSWAPCLVKTLLGKAAHPQVFLREIALECNRLLPQAWPSSNIKTIQDSEHPPWCCQTQLQKTTESLYFLLKNEHSCCQRLDITLKSQKNKFQIENWALCHSPSFRAKTSHSGTHFPRRCHIPGHRKPSGPGMVDTTHKPFLKWGTLLTHHNIPLALSECSLWLM